MFCLAIAYFHRVFHHIHYSSHYTCIVSTAIRILLCHPSEAIGTCSVPQFNALHCHSFFRHIHDSSHYAWVNFNIVQYGVLLTSSAAFDVLGELQSTKFGWIRTIVCSRLSCSGLRSTGLLGGCRPSRCSYLRSDFALFCLFS